MKSEIFQTCVDTIYELADIDFNLISDREKSEAKHKSDRNSRI